MKNNNNMVVVMSYSYYYYWYRPIGCPDTVRRLTIGTNEIEEHYNNTKYTKSTGNTKGPSKSPLTSKTNTVSDQIGTTRTSTTTTSTRQQQQQQPRRITTSTRAAIPWAVPIRSIDCLLTEMQSFFDSYSTSSSTSSTANAITIEIDGTIVEGISTISATSTGTTIFNNNNNKSELELTKFEYEWKRICTVFNGTCCTGSTTNRRRWNTNINTTTTSSTNRDSNNNITSLKWMVNYTCVGHDNDNDYLIRYNNKYYQYVAMILTSIQFTIRHFDYTDVNINTSTSMILDGKKSSMSSSSSSSSTTGSIIKVLCRQGHTMTVIQSITLRNMSNQTFVQQNYDDDNYCDYYFNTFYKLIVVPKLKQFTLLLLPVQVVPVVDPSKSTDTSYCTRSTSTNNNNTTALLNFVQDIVTVNVSLIELHLDDLIWKQLEDIIARRRRTLQVPAITTTLSTDLTTKNYTNDNNTDTIQEYVEFHLRLCQLRTILIQKYSTKIIKFQYDTNNKNNNKSNNNNIVRNNNTSTVRESSVLLTKYNFKMQPINSNKPGKNYNNNNNNNNNNNSNCPIDNVQYMMNVIDNGCLIIKDWYRTYHQPHNFLSSDIPQTTTTTTTTIATTKTTLPSASYTTKMSTTIQQTVPLVVELKPTSSSLSSSLQTMNIYDESSLPSSSILLMSLNSHDTTIHTTSTTTTTVSSSSSSSLSNNKQKQQILEEQQDDGIVF